MRHNIHFIHSVKKVKLFPLFLLPILLVFTADATLSYIFPIIVENTLKSNTLLGIIMSLSSVAGFFCDLWYPFLFKNKSWHFQLSLGILLSILFPFSVYLSHYFAPIVLFIFASMIWGIYFDMIIFSEDNFVVDEENKNNFTRDWSIIYTITLFTWIIGPILGEYLSSLIPSKQFFVIAALQILGFIIALMLPYDYKEVGALDSQKSHRKNIRSSLYELFKSWKVLSVGIYSFLIVLFVSKLIESAYWMFGGLYAENLGIAEGMHWIMLGTYTFALIIGSVTLTYLNIKKNKEIISSLALFLSGVFLFMSTYFVSSIVLFIILVFLSSICISIVTPLRNSQFSEYLNKIGNLRSNAIGLSCAVGSLSYIIGPTLLGIISDITSYNFMFGTLGMLAFLSSLFIILPKLVNIKKEYA